MIQIGEHLDLVLLGLTCLALMAGYPVAFTLGGMAAVFAVTANMFGGDVPLTALPIRVFGIIANETLLAVPLFILMGMILERSKVAEDLLVSLSAVFRHVSGGPVVAVTLVGGILAASTGIVGATVVTLGLIALPGLLRQGFGARLTCGTIAAAGTLGQIIPPSIVLVFLSDQLSAAHQSAQRERGVFLTEPFSVADLFAAAIGPGLVLVLSYAVLQFIWVRFGGKKARENVQDPGETPNGSVLFSLLPPLGLVLCVLGSILGGIATATEAAALGVGGAIVLAGARQSARPVLYSVGPTLAAALLVVLVVSGSHLTGVGWVSAVTLSMAILVGIVANLLSLHRAGVLSETLVVSVHMTAMVFTIMIGATLFALVFRELGGDETIQSSLANLPGGAAGGIFVVMLAMFVLGFFLDFLEIVFIVVPLVAPVLLQMPMPDGSTMAPAWLGTMIAVNLQTSFLTPPFGFALFYLRGAAPDHVLTRDIYLGAAPFVLVQLLVLVLLWFWPALATWLPQYLYG